MVAGDAVNATIEVSNLALNPADSVAVVTSLPNDLEFASTIGCAEDPDGYPLCGLGGVPAGESRRFDVRAGVDSDASGTLPVTFVATSPTGDANPTNDVRSILLPVARQADFEVSLDNGIAFFAQGDVQPVEYLLTVRNNGPSDGQRADVVFQPPAAFQAEQWLCFSDPGVNCSPTGPGAPFETIDAVRGGEALFVISGTLDPAVEGTIVAQATATGAIDAVDTAPANNVALDRDSVGLFGDGFESAARAAARATARTAGLGDWLVVAEPAARRDQSRVGNALAARVVDDRGRTVALVLERHDSAGERRLQLATVAADSNRLFARSAWLSVGAAGFRVLQDEGLVLEARGEGGGLRAAPAGLPPRVKPVEVVASANWRVEGVGR